MDPQTPIDQVPSENLAIIGWNLREEQDTARRQVDLIKQKLRMIREELSRRTQAIREQGQKAVDEKASLATTVADAVLAKLAERNGKFPPPAEEHVKATDETKGN